MLLNINNKIRNLRFLTAKDSILAIMTLTVFCSKYVFGIIETNLDNTGYCYQIAAYGYSILKNDRNRKVEVNYIRINICFSSKNISLTTWKTYLSTFCFQTQNQYQQALFTSTEARPNF